MLHDLAATFSQAMYTAWIFRNGFQELLINTAYLLAILTALGVYVGGRALVRKLLSKKSEVK